MSSTNARAGVLKFAAALLATLLLVSSAAAQEFARPKAWLLTPFTGFPDVLAASLLRPIGERGSFEHGASLWLPSVFVRAGYTRPVLRTSVREVSFAILAGGRTALIPVEGGGVLTGPTVEVGVLSYPLSETELVMYLTAGGWLSWNVSQGFHSSDWDRELVPSVRLGIGKPL